MDTFYETSDFNHKNVILVWMSTYLVEWYVCGTKWVNLPFLQHLCWEWGVWLERAARETETPGIDPPPRLHIQHKDHRYLYTGPSQIKQKLYVDEFRILGSYSRWMRQDKDWDQTKQLRKTRKTQANTGNEMRKSWKIIKEKEKNRQKKKMTKETQGYLNLKDNKSCTGSSSFVTADFFVCVTLHIKWVN